MPRRQTPPPKPADWSPAKTYAALKKQLTALDSLRGRNWRDAEHQEDGWTNLTVNILTHGFGEDSNNIRQFYNARSAGEHYINASDFQIQANFEKRIEAFAAMLKSSLDELELMGAADEAPPSPIVVPVALQERGEA